MVSMVVLRENVQTPCQTRMAEPSVDFAFKLSTIPSPRLYYGLYLYGYYHISRPLVMHNITYIEVCLRETTRVQQPVTT
jgi:hypothetical protein